MEDIHVIYSNDFGITFQWKNIYNKNPSKIQLVFKDTGLSLTNEELYLFNNQINEALTKIKYCEHCSLKDKCRSHLVECPFTNVSFAMSSEEMRLLKNLVRKSIFTLSKQDLFSNYCWN